MRHSPRLPAPSRMVRLLLAAGLAAGVLVAGGAPVGAATAATDECAQVVGDLRIALNRLPNRNAQPGSAAQIERTERATELFRDSATQYPECQSEIEVLGQELAALARRQTVKGTPFWGPIGWMWNNVYYRVFNANNVMMALFGWALLLSPIILVVSTYWVLRGSKGAFHRPYVPEHLRTDS